MIHTSRPPASAALGQRLGRIPYAPKSKVATQRRDHRPVIYLQCVADHTVRSKLHFFSFRLRYLAFYRSKRASYLGQQNNLSSAVSNLFENLNHLEKTFVDEVYSPSQYDTNDDSYQELPVRHNTQLLKSALLTINLCCLTELGAVGDNGVLRCVFRRKGKRCCEDYSDRRASGAMFLTGSASAKKGNQGENSDFHVRLLSNSAGSYVPPIFLAESYFTGRTPQLASSDPCCVAVGAFHV